MFGLDIIFILGILILAQVAISVYAKGESAETKSTLQNLWLYHLFFGLVYMTYVLNFGGDAVGYWKELGSLELYIERGAGTYFIHLLNYPFVHLLDLSFLTGSIMYSFVGYLGILYFYKSTIALVPTHVVVKLQGYKLFPTIFFLPNLHFWSAGVGKDTLSFFCIGLFLYSITNPSRRLLGIALSLYLVYYVRPHIAIFLLISFGICALLDRRLNFFAKTFLTALCVVGSVYLFDDVMDYINLDEVSTESIEGYSETKVHVLSRSAGTGVDMSSYPLPIKIFTFLFRPLFLDIRNITGLLASFENLILLILVYQTFRTGALSSFKAAPFPVKGIILFIIISSLGFSNILGNLGVMMRMKNMLTPGLLLFILYALTYKKQKEVMSGNLGVLQHKGRKPKVRLV